ncbi:cytochrome c biogenesis protein CcsA [Neisseriaceae bacterium TC5R-5]|nr:cytochrome c biogenesis protein CcsA [Neisseriaceae bacterium TC5R-5]
MNSLPLVLSLILIGCYGVFTWHYLTHWQGTARWPRQPRREHSLLGILLLVQAIAVLLPLTQGTLLSLGVGHVLALMAWMMLLIYWTCSFFYRVEGLQLFMMPLAMLTLAFAQVLPGQHIMHNVYNPALILHILMSLLAYSLFAISALIAIMMLFLERALHGKHNSTLTQQLPPLLSLEKMMFQVIRVGFLLLSISLLTGVVFSKELLGYAASLSHKTVFAILSWLLFGSLLVGHRLRGWRGKVAVRWTLAGFLSLLLAYIGSKVVLELILHRT